MNWVVFSVLTGFVLFNLLGVGLFHNEWKNEHKKGEWKKSFDFWKWTVYLFLFGICYCVIRLILWIRCLLSKK